MRPLPAVLLLAALAAASPSCGTITSRSANETIADIGEFLGTTRPSRHVERLASLHDTSTFAHRPDLPPTTESCLEEVRTLEGADYTTWREVAVATFYVTRVAAEDTAAFNRGEAVRALVRLGGMLLEHEEVPAIPVTGDQAARALKALREAHDPVSNLHVSPEAVGACAEQVAVLSGFRVDAEPDALKAEVLYELRLLRGLLLGLAVETRSPDSHAGGGLGAAVDRAVVNLASQAVRLSLASALRFDDEPTVRSAAARALEVLAIPGMAGVLKAAYRGERAVPVRRSVVAAAGVAAAPGKGDREGAVALLVAALSDDDESIGFLARDLLRGLAGEDLGPRAGPWLRWWGSGKNGEGE